MKLFFFFLKTYLQIDRRVGPFNHSCYMVNCISNSINFVLFLRSSLFCVKPTILQIVMYWMGHHVPFFSFFFVKMGHHVLDLAIKQFNFGFLF